MIRLLKLMDIWYNYKHMRNSKVLSGFTLIELSLSIVFISILSIAVVVIVMNAISSYHRGVILNQINTTGMEIVDDMRASIQNSSALSVKSECGSVYAEGVAADSVLKNCENDAGRNFVFAMKTMSVQVGNRTMSNVPVYGAICTGNYSYIWNSGYLFSDSKDVKVEGKWTKTEKDAMKAKLTYRRVKSDGVTVEKTTASGSKLLKVHDEARAVCIAAAGVDYVTGAGRANNNFDISSDAYDVVDEAPIDVLEGSTAVALYDLSTSVPAESTSVNNMFYNISFILGTISGGINVMSTGDFCTTPGDLANGSIENFDYCAINKFNFAVQASGE